MIKLNTHTKKNGQFCWVKQGGLLQPRYDGTNYSTWKSWMEYHLNSLLLGILKIIKSSYIALNGGHTTLDEIKVHENNAKVINILVCSLSD